jgi:hypothetical protein
MLSPSGISSSPTSANKNVMGDSSTLRRKYFSQSESSLHKESWLLARLVVYQKFLIFTISDLSFLDLHLPKIV